MKYAIGLDVGGTKIHSVVAEWDKDFLSIRKLPKIVQSRRIALQNKKSESKFFGEVTGEISRLIAELGKSNVARVGVGIAGPLSRDKVSLNSPNLPLKNFPTLKKLEEKFGPKIYVDNDANCFTWAEHLFGAAVSASSSVGITLGTGVGGGIVLGINGRPMLWEGHNGGSAEIGHMILDRERSFEDLCSSKAEYLWKGEGPLAIEQKALAGDKEAKEVYRKYGFWLGIGVANTINVVDPEIVVIGGSISKAWDLFEKEMRAIAKKYIISTLAKKTKIVRAKLGDDAGALGAAYLI
ncbi:MAG: ROK family protein [Candidatus Spechtbacterales bacterium]